MMQVWWANWKSVTFRIITLGASYLTLLGVVLPISSSVGSFPNYKVVLLLISALALVVLIILEIRSMRWRKTFRASDAKGIKKYMHDWIDHGGRVVIWTRDMSWAENPETAKLLRDKATKKELIICMPKISPFAKSLSNKGAEVCTYDDAHFDPEARFTIREYKRKGSRVAFGYVCDGFHVIEEHDSYGHPVHDLINLVRSR